MRLGFTRAVTAFVSPPSFWLKVANFGSRCCSRAGVARRSGRPSPRARRLAPQTAHRFAPSSALLLLVVAPRNRRRSMDEERLLALFKASLRSEGVAMKQDIGGINTRLDAHDNRFDEIEKRMHKLEKQQSSGARDGTPPLPARRSTGSSSSTSAETRSPPRAAETRDSWVPRLVHIRGFAPYNCSAADNFKKRDLLAYQ